MTQEEERKFLKELDQNEELKTFAEQATKMINDRLHRASPGAHFERGEEFGTFFIVTPSKKLPIESLHVLGMMMDLATTVGEAALIRLIERANKFAPLYYGWEEMNPERMDAETFAERMFETGDLAIELRMALDAQMKLDDAEGQILGMSTATILINILKPFNCNIAASGERSSMMLNMPGERYPIGSPTVFSFVLRHIHLNSREDLKAALAITNFIITLPIFPEFKGGGIAVSEN
jgi:hypothetical protein